MKRFTEEHKKCFEEIRQDVIDAEDTYWEEVGKIEKMLSKKTGIEIELFHSDGYCVGVGDYNRDYKLIHWSRT